MKTRPLEEILKRLRETKHKDGVNVADWDKVKRPLLYMADYVLDFCDDHGIECVFTSIIRPKIPGISVSKTHEEGRAFDIRVRFTTFTTDLIDQLIAELNEHFKDIAPIPLKGGKPTAAVYEFPTKAKPDVVEHIHCQCKR